MGRFNAMLADDGRLPAIAPVYYVSIGCDAGCRATPFTSVFDALERMGNADEALGGHYVEGNVPHHGLRLRRSGGL